MRYDSVHPSFWLAAALLLGALLLPIPIAPTTLALIATALFLAGGLPHGAYDIALLQRAVALRVPWLVLAVAAYVGIAVAMVAAWLAVPVLALVLFLGIAAVHFGEDWPMLEEPLLRFAAGAAIIAAPAIGHPGEVAMIFTSMSDPRARLVAQCATAAAPVTLLVTTVGIGIAWRQGSWVWAAAMTLCLGLLIAAPPVAGFALYFVFLHAPRHLAHTRQLLGDMARWRWLMIGALLSGAAIAGWVTLEYWAGRAIGHGLTAQAFQLLASVAVPHLLLSRWLARRLT